jgi:ABC-2 type transport system ATP-binding protein
MCATAAPATTAPAARTSDVSFAYGERQALDGLTLEISAGSVFGLLGPNGSGKSTLLSLLAGLREPSSGAVTVLGEAPAPALRARMGLLFQETSLDRLMTARETLWLHGRLYGLGGGALRGRIEAALAEVGLGERAGSLVSTLSGGMKRRLELARVLLPAPQLILLDEPTTGLDPDAEAAIWSRLRAANGAGATVVVATNKVREAEDNCDRVAFLHHGRLTAQGTPGELKAALKRDAVWVEWPEFRSDLAEEIAAWGGVGRLTWSPPVLHATVDAASAFVPRLFATAGDGIRGVRIRESTLEDAYFDIVGAALSEAEAER